MAYDPMPIATEARRYEALFALEDRRAARLAAMRRHPSNYRPDSADDAGADK